MTPSQRQESEHKENAFSSHHSAELMHSIQWTEEHQQPASHFRTRECSTAFATAMLIISIRMISDDNNKSQWQPHGGIPENPARFFWAVAEKHWSKLKLIILSAVFRVPETSRGATDLCHFQSLKMAHFVFFCLCACLMLWWLFVSLEGFLPGGSLIKYFQQYPSVPCKLN